jgi:hypothetical protein
MKLETEIDLLKAIDRKLAALLAITLDSMLRNHPEIAKPRPRTLDRMLADVGVGAKEIAALLGKTEQAVYLQLAKDGKAKPRNARVIPTPDVKEEDNDPA